MLTAYIHNLHNHYYHWNRASRSTADSAAIVSRAHVDDVHSSPALTLLLTQWIVGGPFPLAGYFLTLRFMVSMALIFTSLPPHKPTR